jgi:hypothetical protein
MEKSSLSYVARRRTISASVSIIKWNLSKWLGTYGKSLHINQSGDENIAEILKATEAKLLYVDRSRLHAVRYEIKMARIRKHIQTLVNIILSEIKEIKTWLPLASITISQLEEMYDRIMADSEELNRWISYLNDLDRV